MAKLFKYKLTQNQYDRFVKDPKTTYQIQVLGKPLGVLVKDANPDDPIFDWYFTGTCSGGAGLQKVGEDWYCFVKLETKPWYIPNFVFDIAFQAALQ